MRFTFTLRDWLWLCVLIGVVITWQTDVHRSTPDLTICQRLAFWLNPQE